MKQRAERKAILDLTREIKEARKKEREEKRKKTEEKRRIKEENTRKAEIVQVIRNPAKLKRMSKKELRNVRKADTTTVSRENKTS